MVSTGGGGIPVVSVNGVLQGVEAVIDKDRASALLAAELGVDLFAISTDTDYVYLNYKRPGQRAAQARDRCRVGEAPSRRTFSAGQYGTEGGVGAALSESGGKEAVITSFEHLCDAVSGSAGTHIVRDRDEIDHLLFNDLALSARG